jgi:hypothetical protein
VAAASICRFFASRFLQRCLIWIDQQASPLRNGRQLALALAKVT